ncbi:MAG: hypothetical protein P8Y05_13660, partial [Deinococcales bacterium]
MPRPNSALSSNSEFDHAGPRLQEEVPVALALLLEGELRDHVQRLVTDPALVLGGADFHAQAAARAVFHGDLQGIAKAVEFAPPCLHRQEAFRRALESGGLDHLGADHGMRTDQHALAAFDADLGIPRGDLLRQIALLEAGGGARVGAVRGERAHGQVVAPAGNHLGRDRPHEVGRVLGHDRRHRRALGALGRRE